MENGRFTLVNGSKGEAQYTAFREGGEGLKNFLHLRREQGAGRLNKHTMRKLLQYMTTFLNIWW